MKKLCFFSGDITRSGGTERVAIRIANELQKQGKYEIMFLSLVEQADKPFFKIAEGISRYALGDKWINPGPGYIKLISKLKKFLREHEVDLILDIDIVLDVLALPASKNYKTKVLSWEHFNYQFETSVFYRKMILKYSVKRSDYIVTLTNQDRESYERAFGRQEGIQAIGNPTDLTFGGASYELDKREKMLVTAVRLTYTKGTDYLLQVAKRVLEERPDWKWYVLGDGEDKETMREFVRENGLERRLVIAGRVEKVQEYFEKARIFVLTSRVEGLPMCLLEAKASNLPCVGFDIPTGPSELIEDEVNGYLLPAFDVEGMVKKLGSLMDDEEKQKEFATNAMKDMDRYSIQSIMQQWNEVIEKLCE